MFKPQTIPSECTTHTRTLLLPHIHTCVFPHTSTNVSAHVSTRAQGAHSLTTTHRQARSSKPPPSSPRASPPEVAALAEIGVFFPICVTWPPLPLRPPLPSLPFPVAARLGSGHFDKLALALLPLLRAISILISPRIGFGGDRSASSRAARPTQQQPSPVRADGRREGERERKRGIGLPRLLRLRRFPAGRPRGRGGLAQGLGRGLSQGGGCQGPAERAHRTSPAPGRACEDVSGLCVPR